MKRQNDGIGYAAMKKGHEEKDMKHTMCADLRYSKYGDDNEKELAENVDKLANYVKKNRHRR